MQYLLTAPQRYSLAGAQCRIEGLRYQLPTLICCTLVQMSPQLAELQVLTLAYQVTREPHWRRRP